MANAVNLDALISREDFEVLEDSTQSQFVQTIQIRDLEPGSFFLAAIRKPDFQRETADWTPKKICEFIESYLDGDLIPAIILWNAGTYNFVIDGAHRLSALIAWVHDDYGDGGISQTFFEGRIPDEQRKLAEESRRLINRRMGSYQSFKLAIQSSDNARSEVLIRSKRLATLALQLQWVKGDANKAEASFFRINQQAAPIDQTELRLLKSRRRPNALAARAIIRSGTGHKYWSKFDDDTRTVIEVIAEEINGILFKPPLRTPIKTMDLPIAGRGYSAQSLPLIFDYVNLVNGVSSDEDLPIDNDGQETIQYLKATRKISQRMSGTHPSSLGLHPAVYFYGAAGRHQPTSFLAIAGLMKVFEERDLFHGFTLKRRMFEDFLLHHKPFVTQLVYRYGSGTKSSDRLRDLYLKILMGFIDGATEEEVLSDLYTDPQFSFLKTNDQDTITSTAPDFSQDAKSSVFLREALLNPLRCKICGGLIHSNSMTIDHIERRAEGGLGTPDNGQLAHPYCNTTFKH